MGNITVKVLGGLSKFMVPGPLTLASIFFYIEKSEN